MTISWTPVSDEAQLRFIGAASRIIKDSSPVPCPVCGGAPLRFYYHEFRVIPRRTGTIWVWCPICHSWEHVSRVELPPTHVYDDPFATLTLDEFDSLERAGLLDRVDALWEHGRLPHAFRVSDTKNRG